MSIAAAPEKVKVFLRLRPFSE
jgi:kinesin family protein 5